MGTTQKVVGTSLEVLAPYLPYRPLVALTGSEYALPFSGMEVFSINAANGVLYCKGQSAGFFFSEVLPVLRPFSALATPLEDGTIPAVEVAKILLAYQYDVQYHRYEASHVHKVRCKQPGLECYQVTVPGLNDNLVVAIYNNLDLENEDRGVDSADVLAVVDYLRRNHFAVGLDASQFIEKSPAPTPSTIQQKGGGEL